MSFSKFLTCKSSPRHNSRVSFFRNICPLFVFLLVLGCGNINGSAISLTPSPIIIPYPSVAPSYPTIVYDKLPALHVPSGTSLVASPLFPKSQLADTKIKAEEDVYLVASDKDNAWLLVIYKNTLGWVPSILSAVGTGVLDPITIEIAEPSNCATFIGSITTSNGIWTSDISATAQVQGYIYIHDVEETTGEIDLKFLIEETGKSYPVQSNHTQLEAGDELVQFHTTISDLKLGNHVKYKMNGINQNTTPFQAAFFVNDCSNDATANEPNPNPQAPVTLQPPISTLVVRITSSALPPTFAQQESDFANYSCPDKSKVKLRVGMRAVVSRDDVNLRSSPQVPDVWDANIIIVLRQGDKMTVVGGPRCAHDGTWWKVETDRGYTGWIRELLPSRILIEPVS